MKIVIDNGGQTCNKFWSYLAPIDYSIKTGKRVYVLFPDKDLEFYPNLLSNKHLKILHFKLLSKIIPFKTQERFFRRLLTNKYYNLLNYIKKRFRNIVWNSWDNRFISLDKDTKKKVLEILSPSKNIIDEIQKCFSTKRDSDTLIIGVHIRRGDYKTWQDGRYYFSQGQYRDICNSLKSEFPDKKILFFLSSNEAIDNNIFRAKDGYFTVPNTNAAKDLYALSQCDYIIGPPSTFSRWAAYSGDKPIRFIISAKQISKAFQKLKSIDTYISGDLVSDSAETTFY